eukprot:scpid97049/ scgid13510/ 
MMEMEDNERDMFIMGMLLATHYCTPETRRGKRKHEFYQYSYDGQEVCSGAFQYIYNIGKKLWRNLKKHLQENGPVPRRHGNIGRRPANALQFPDVKRCVEFLKAYVEEFGLPHPAPTHGRAGVPPTYLPVSQTYKSVHKIYADACISDNCRAAGLQSFRNIWSACLPHVKFMIARTDVCQPCEVLRRKVVSAATEADKTEALDRFSQHIAGAQAERKYYRDATVAAHNELSGVAAAPVPPC